MWLYLYVRWSSLNPTTVCRNYLCVGARPRSPSTYTYLSEFIYVSELNYEVRQPTYLSEFIHVLELNYEVRQPNCRNSSTCRRPTTNHRVNQNVPVGAKLQSPSQASCLSSELTVLSYGHCLMLFVVNIHHEVTRVSIRRAEVHYVYCVF